MTPEQAAVVGALLRDCSVRPTIVMLPADWVPPPIVDASGKVLAVYETEWSKAADGEIPKEIRFISGKREPHQ